ALNEFEGTVMLVSHDRALLREVCDEFWLVADGALKPFDGDLDDYQRWLLERSREAAKAAADSSRKLREEAAAGGSRREDRKAAAAARQARADEIKPLKKELTLTDHRLGVLFGERDKLEASFADTALSPEQIAEAGKRLKTVNEDIERLEGRWLELSTRIDELGADR
ncbi:MAG TPA: ABC transporter, partial [Piscinibacter sp.]|nr:ABC transporter [Piscinibacter sp.]